MSELARYIFREKFFKLLYYFKFFLNLCFLLLIALLVIGSVGGILTAITSCDSSDGSESECEALQLVCEGTKIKICDRDKLWTEILDCSEAVPIIKIDGGVDDFTCCEVDGGAECLPLGCNKTED